jgi:hypothetical protein
MTIKLYMKKERKREEERERERDEGLASSHWVGSSKIHAEPTKTD